MSADPMEDPDARQKGLQARYEVSKIDDPTGKHDDCAYFVLDPQHDPIAALALAAYSKEARRRGYFPLANDLDTWLREVDPTDEIDEQIRAAQRAAQAGEDLETILAKRRDTLAERKREL